MDIFISKLDTAGNFIWAKSIGGTDSDYGVSICSDPSANILITGHFTTTVDFDPGPGIFNMTATGTDIYIAKFNSNGDLQWAKTLGEPHGGFGNFITLDA